MEINVDYYVEATLRQKTGVQSRPREIALPDVFKQISIVELTTRIGLFSKISTTCMFASVPQQQLDAIDFIDKQTGAHQHVTTPWPELMPTPPFGGNSLNSIEQLHRGILMGLREMISEDIIRLIRESFSRVAVQTFNIAQRLSTDTHNRDESAKDILWQIVQTGVIDTFFEEGLIKRRIPLAFIADARPSEQPVDPNWGIVMKQSTIVANRVCRALGCEEICK